MGWLTNWHVYVCLLLFASLRINGCASARLHHQMCPRPPDNSPYRNLALIAAWMGLLALVTVTAAPER